MKRRLAVIVAVLLVLSRGPAPMAGTNLPTLQRVPSSAIVTIQLLKAPGLKLPGSKWEIAYEFRVIPESRLWPERDKLKEGSTERAGELIKKATLAKSLDSSQGQTLLLKIPFDAPTLDKLKNQPVDRL